MLRERGRPGLPNRGLKASTSGGGFTPASISGLGLWLDAADTATITQTAGAVSQWSDKSGNLRNATQGTGANQPTTGTRTINGKNAIDFDGSNDLLEYDGTFLAAQPYTIFVVEQFDTARMFLGANNATTNGNLNMGYNTTSVFRNGQFNNEIQYNLGSPFTSSVRCWTNQKTNSGWIMRENGVSRSSNANSTKLVSYVSARIGGNPPDGSNYDGIIGEILIYNAIVSDTDINLIGNYLAAKWGFAWTAI